MSKPDFLDLRKFDFTLFMKIFYVVVSLSTGRWPASPIPLTETFPFGLILIAVTEACFKDILSQAYGGKCKARYTK